MRVLLWVVFGFLTTLCLHALFRPGSAVWASQTSLTAGGAANLAATCTFAGATIHKVTLSATSAKIATPTGQGNVRIVCTQDAYFLQGVNGVTGVTATTGSSLMPGYQTEYINANNSTFAFIRDTADGYCFVTECK